MDKGAGDYGPPKLSSSSHFVVYWDRRERHQNALVMMRRTSLGIRRQIGPIVLQSPQGRMMNYSVTWTFRRSKLEESSNWWCALTFVRVLTTATSINKVDKFWISSHWADRNAAVIWCTYEALFSSNKSSTLNKQTSNYTKYFVGGRIGSSWCHTCMFTRLMWFLYIALRFFYRGSFSTLL